MGLARGRLRSRQYKKICCSSSVGSFSRADILRFDLRFFRDFFFDSFTDTEVLISGDLVALEDDGFRGLPFR